MAKWDRIFRIAVVLLLSANLAVSGKQRKKEICNRNR